MTSSSGTFRIHDQSGAVTRNVEPPEGSVFRQPTWIDGDRVLVSLAGGDAQGLMLYRVSTGVEVWRTSLATAPFYFSPAPSGSPFLATSLRNDPSGDGLVAELVDEAGGTTEVSRLSPFYTAWAPDGQALATHTEGRLLSIRTSESVTEIATPTGPFQAPAWTGDGLITLRTVSARQLLSSYSDGMFRDLAAIGGPSRFVAAGGRVAIQTVGSGEAGIEASASAQQIASLPTDILSVVEIGSAVVQTVSQRPAVFFHWNADGRRLAFATIVDGRAGVLEWHVWNGSTVAVDQFVAQPGWIREVLPFFDQYAQSASIWNARGTAIAYPAVVEGEHVVVVHTIGGVMTSIQDATWAAWSR